MNRLLLVFAAVSTLACSRDQPRRAAPARETAAPTAPEPATEMQTMDNAEARPAVMDPPPMLTDIGAAVAKLKMEVARPDALPPPTKADEALRASLPFTPAIAMDPVDGSKVSIRTSTPMYEYKGRICYFSSEANKRTFVNDPEAYLKGLFSHL